MGDPQVAFPFILLNDLSVWVDLHQLLKDRPGPNLTVKYRYGEPYFPAVDAAAVLVPSARIIECSPQ